MSNGSAILATNSSTENLCVDLFTGLHGWCEAFVEAGYHVIGVDIVDMPKELGLPPLEGLELILADVLTLHGSRFKDAAVIVASPPCQKYSYMAMPWKKAKALAAWYRESPERIKELNALFDACFRIQREATEAAGRHVPLIVENVKGAQPWVGSAKANFGSFYLWGDVGMVGKRVVAGPLQMGAYVAPRSRGQKVPGFRFDGSGGSFQTASVEAVGQKENPDGTGHPPGSWFAIADSKNRGAKTPESNCVPVLWKEREIARYAHPTPGEMEKQGFKLPGQNWSRFAGTKGFTPNGEPLGKNTLGRRHSSKSKARKAASAMIAKIPFPLARHIAASFKPPNSAHQ